MQEVHTIFFHVDRPEEEWPALCGVPSFHRVHPASLQQDPSGSLQQRRPSALLDPLLAT